MTEKPSPRSAVQDLFGSDPLVVARVLLPVAIGMAYSYRVPPGMSVEPGAIVRVPLGPREVIGAVWEIVGGEAATEVPAARLKDTFEFKKVGPYNLKGVGDEIYAWEVVL